MHIIKWVLLAILLATGCIKRSDRFDGNALSQAAGVDVWGSTGVGEVYNTNPFPVRIKFVYQYRGESTIWLKYFEPGEHHAIEYMAPNYYAFYVIDTNGVEIGFIDIKEE